MKYLRYLLVVLLCAPILSFNLSKTEVPKDVERKLRRDAARLALRIEVGQHEVKYAPVFIPTGNIEAIYDALTKVYKNTEVGESLYRCNIHTYPSPSIDHMVLIYDREIEWAEPLRKGLTETSNKEFNNLLRKYNIFIERHVQWTESEDALTLRSRQPINMAAVASEFMDIGGILDIDLGIPKILGSDIEASRLDKAWKLNYILRFGAWATGSGKSHTWQFRVSDQGKVETMGEMGDPVPKWMRCRFDNGSFLTKL